jgi:guanylate kinase
MDYTNYQPTKAVLEHLKQVVFVAVVGPSGVGKTTLMQAALTADPTLHFVLTDVSRPARPGEQDGIDYNFRSREEMTKRAKERAFVQLAVHPSGDLYATRPESYSKEGINIMAVLADVLPIFRGLPFKSFKTIFIVPPSYEIWQARLNASHNLDPEQLAKRLPEAKRSLHFARTDQAVEYVVNDNFNSAKADFIGLVHGQMSEKCKLDQVKARACITDILQQLATS